MPNFFFISACALRRGSKKIGLRTFARERPCSHSFSHYHHQFIIYLLVNSLHPVLSLCFPLLGPVQHAVQGSRLERTLFCSDAYSGRRCVTLVIQRSRPADSVHNGILGSTSPPFLPMKYLCLRSVKMQSVAIHACCLYLSRHFIRSSFITLIAYATA